MAVKRFVHTDTAVGIPEAAKAPPKKEKPNDDFTSNAAASGK